MNKTLRSSHYVKSKLQYLKLEGFTTTELAKQIGISQSVVSKILKSGNERKIQTKLENKVIAFYEKYELNKYINKINSLENKDFGAKLELEDDIETINDLAKYTKIVFYTAIIIAIVLISLIYLFFVIL